jgi:hypothetical protein
MAFWTKTNTGRVEKMQEFLHLILKSAQTNETPKGELQELLDPILSDLQPYLSKPEPAAPVEEKKGRVGVTAPQWASVMDMAKEASLKDLAGAMYVYLQRVDQELHHKP